MASLSSGRILFISRIIRIERTMRHAGDKEGEETEEEGEADDICRVECCKHPWTVDIAGR